MPIFDARCGDCRWGWRPCDTSGA